MIDRNSVSKSYFIFMIIYLDFEAENGGSLFTEESFLHTLFDNVYFQNKSVIFFRRYVTTYTLPLARFIMLIRSYFYSP